MSGGNTFIYNKGYGALEISDENEYPAPSILSFGAGITQAELSVASDAYGDLILNVADGDAGEKIQLDSMLSRTTFGVEGVQFAGGTSMTEQQLLALATIGSATNTSLNNSLGNATFDSKGFAHYESGGLSGGNTFIYNSGYGALEISDENETTSPNVIKFGTGITAAQLAISSDAYGDMLIADGKAGDQIKVDSMLSNAMYELQSVQFSNGTSLTGQQLAALATTGSATNTSLFDNLGNATFDSKGFAHYENASYGSNNSFIYNLGYGVLEISAYAPYGGTNILKFGTGITAAQLVVSSDAYNDLIIGDGKAGDQIKLDSMLSNPLDGITSVQFSNGTSLTAQQLITLANTGSATNTSLDDELGGATFDSKGYAHYESASYCGNNIFIYNTGYGALEINAYNPYGAPGDVLSFGAGILSSNVVLSKDTSGDLILTVDANGDQIKLDSMLNNTQDGVQTIKFADGTIWNAATIDGFNLSATGVKTYFINETAGNVTITPVTGSQVYVGGNGVSGNDNIINMSSGQVAFQSGARADTHGNGNTITAVTSDTVGIYGTGNTATVGTGGSAWIGTGGGNVVTAGSGDYVNVAGNGQAGTADKITLSSGTAALQTGANATFYGTANTITVAQNDTVTIASGNATLIAGTGGDVFTNAGGSGNTYKLSNGFGADTINNAGSGSTVANGSVAFLGSLTDENLWFQRSGNNLLVDQLGTSSQLTLTNWYSTANADVSKFTAGGLTLDSQIAQLVQAMATYATAHTGFNPVTATAMPTDTTLQNTITTAWHH